MKVLIVEPGEYPREAEIEDTLEAEQGIVGGLIECAYPWDNIDHGRAILVCNDEGLMNGMPLNRAINESMVIAGTFFVCGENGENFASLTPNQMEQYKKLLHDPQVFARTPLGVVVRPTTPERYKRIMGQQPKKPNRNTYER